MEMKIQIISREIIKPSSPTPPHLKKLTLSLLDQKYSSFLVPVLLFYAPPHEAAPPLDIDHLKTCLSQTLTTFYPLAGRVESVGSILCNDEGVPFIEARVNCTLSSVLGSLWGLGTDLTGFYPPKDGLVDEGVQVSIQVNVFTCGGFCVGWYHIHKVTDGTSMGSFFRYWAALAAQRVEYAAQDLADFSSAVRVFPPIEERPVTPELKHKIQDEKEETIEGVGVFPPAVVAQEERQVTPKLNHNKKQNGYGRDEKREVELNSSVFPLVSVSHQEKQMTPRLNHKILTGDNIDEQKEVDFNSVVTVLPPTKVPQEERHVTPELNHKKQNENERDEKKETDFNFSVSVLPPMEGTQEERQLTPELNQKNQNGNETGKENNEEKKGSSWSFHFQNRIVVRSFVIKNEAVAKLKAKSINEQLTNPSRFEAIAGFLWKSILSNSTKDGPSALNVAVDLRPRVDPPLPVESMGNIFITALVRSEKNAEFHELVAKIHDSISEMKELASELQGDKREEAKDRHWKKFINTVVECKGKDVYVITPWCKSAGFSDVDFGFGNPKRVVPVDDVVNHNQRNTIILTEFGDGFEAWMFLEEECIKFLESNLEFLAFATPNF